MRTILTLPETKFLVLISYQIPGYTCGGQWGCGSAWDARILTLYVSAQLSVAHAKYTMKHSHALYTDSSKLRSVHFSVQLVSMYPSCAATVLQAKLKFGMLQAKTRLILQEQRHMKNREARHRQVMSFIWRSLSCQIETTSPWFWFATLYTWNYIIIVSGQLSGKPLQTSIITIPCGGAWYADNRPWTVLVQGAFFGLW